MRKRADIGLKNAVLYKPCTLLKTITSGVPSAKMRRRADIGLKTLLSTNSALCLKSLAENHLLKIT